MDKYINIHSKTKSRTWFVDSTNCLFYICHLVVLERMENVQNNGAGKLINAAEGAYHTNQYQLV